MKILINYADEKYRYTQMINSVTGKMIGGVDKVYSFTPEDIDNDFRKRNYHILSEKRGNGLWLWKPYFIDKVLSTSNDGDIIFYCDSGAFFVKKIDGIIKSMNDDIWVSDCPLLECCFTKPECFKNMQCESDEYRKTNQIQATYLMFKNSEKSRTFVKEWLQLCTNWDLISPESNSDLKKNDIFQFVSHREDQSILSLLAKKRKVPIHKDPSQRAKIPESFFNKLYAYYPTYHKDQYGTVLWSHKSRKWILWHCIRGIIQHQRMKRNYYEHYKKQTD